MDTLADLAEGLLDDATAMSVRDHLAVCTPCGDYMADLAAIRELLAATPVPVMPSSVALQLDFAIEAEVQARAATPILTAVASAGGELEDNHPGPIGVVGDDGSIKPARRTARRRWKRWAPLVAASAAAVVVGSAVVSSGLLAPATVGQGPSTPAPIAAPPAPGKSTYSLITGIENFTRKDLAKTPLSGWFGVDSAANQKGNAGKLLGSSEGNRLDGCVKRIIDGTSHGRDPHIVYRAKYQGRPATVLVFLGGQAGEVAETWVVGLKCSATEGDIIAKAIPGRW
ncbi:anti-sigma factor family protein [Rhizohabitans arisaemae]|uniref:anti-sigma factor family protein n=1 Tax=Rhizohabitans arisaemae TaxID=2720610 RepID=UPI0024B17908|nr:hypothetical protein [Rhizohabitans arisaemae]